MIDVLITGASGFVGKNLIHKLSDENYSFTKLSLRKKDWEKDLKQTDVDTYIHLAGIAHDIANVNDDKIYYDVNYELTKKLYDCFLKDKKADKFIFFSSVKAAADQPEQILKEDVKPNPKTAYGKSKLMAEKYILDNLPLDKKVFILRPCMIHGAGNKGNLNLLHNFIAKGFPYPFGDFKNKRSFISMDNVCFIINELIRNEKIKSGIYNIADDESLSTVDLVKIMGKTMHKNPSIYNIPKPTIHLIAKVGDVLPLPVNSERVHKLTENYVVSNEKIKKAIKKDLPLTAVDGIKKTLTSF